MSAVDSRCTLFEFELRALYVRCIVARADGLLVEQRPRTCQGVVGGMAVLEQDSERTSSSAALEQAAREQGVSRATHSSAPGSRKDPTAGLVASIDELDGLGLLSLPRQPGPSSVVPPVKQGQQSEVSDVTVAEPAVSRTGPVPPQTATSNGDVASCIQPPAVAAKPKAPPSIKHRTAHSAETSATNWVASAQWFFAATALVAALWYIFSAEPQGESERRLVPGRTRAGATIRN